MPQNINTYLSLITSEHQPWPNFMAFVAALCQASVDQQNQLDEFPSLFDVDLAVGDQLDKIGAWVGVSRQLNQTLSFTPAFIQAVGSGAFATSLAYTNPNAGDNYLIAVFRVSGSPNNPAPTDTLGNEWEQIAFWNNGTDFVYVYHVFDCEIGANIVTSAVACEMVISEYSGVALALPVINGTPAHANGSGTGANSGTTVTTIANCLLFGYVENFTSNGLTFTPTSSFTGRANAAGNVFTMDKLAVTPGPFNATGNYPVTVNWGMGVIALLPATITSLPDDAYRILIKLFIAMNSWDGTVPGIYNIWNAVFAAEGYMILVQDNQDMTMLVVFLNPPTDLLILTIITQGYFLLRPAGVFIDGFYEPSIFGTPIFGFDLESSTLSGWDTGAWMIPVVT